MANFLRRVGVLCVFAFPVALFAQQATTSPPAANLPALKSEAVTEVDKMQTLTQQMVDQIFSFSELGFQEIETSRYLTAVLEKNGFQVERGVAGIPTAWVATYGSGKPVIAFITDIDCARALRKSPAWRITIRSSKARQDTAKDITPAWP